MLKPLLTSLLFFSAAFVLAQPYYYPPTNSDEWTTLDPSELNWCPEKVDSLIDYVGDNNSKSLLILKDGKMVVEHYYDSFTQDSLWYWASAGKSLMAALVGLAQQNGNLDIDDPTSDYLGLGWTSSPPEKEILVTIKHQLSMNTGLHDPNEAPGEISNCLDPECLQYNTDPGDSWAYFNSTYHLVQDVMVEATGMGKNIFTPTLLGNQIGMGGFWFNYIYFSKARDMARFGLFALSEGHWNGTPVLTDSDYFHDMVNTSQDLNLSYGYLWWLNGKESFMLPGGLPTVFTGSMLSNAPDDLYAALGANGQCIFVVPSLDLVVVRQGNAIDGGLIGNIFFYDEMWEQILNLGCTTATEEVVDFELQISPNPTADKLSITTDRPIASLRLIDLHGKTQLTKTDVNSTTEWDIHHLPAGIYYLQIQTLDGHRMTQKVVKSK
ncbi:MAG: hypothetical protein DHS20C18_51560 [Saprospiraceae bacterium]|nr:MAG: hypothetical protein DHS20C18_51560 [Saprospiraceae bacterium]